MKYLDYPELELLSRALTFESSECKVFTRLEAYSCKAVTKEKRLFKTLESAYLRSASMSPPEHLEETLASPFGRLDQSAARKTLFLLIATLNGAFPDHDFSEVNPADFRKEASPAMVLNSLSTTLYSLRSGSNAPRSYSSLPSSYDQRISGGKDGDVKFGFDGRNPNGLGANSFAGSNGYGSNSSPSASHPALAAIMDDIMCISECEVFTFHPDVDSDPHATADLDEEGLSDQEPYDDAYWSDDGDARMNSVQDMGDGTPRQNRYSGDDDTDTPMFDEDFEGGFNASSSSRNPHTSSSEASSEPRTPTTPTTSHGGSKSYFSSKEPHASPSKVQSFSYEENDLLNQAALEEEDDYENEEELDGTGAGLLWATYAFFYNRKLKRILFVSVWSRKSSRNSYNSFNAPASSSHHIPNSSAFGGIQSSSRSSLGDSSKPSDLNRVINSKEAIKGSPARRAIARTNSSGRRTRRIRTPSGSPAPSSLSPFPHASPRSTRSSNQSLLNPPQSSSSLSGEMQSFSAPNATTKSASSSTRNPNHVQDDSAIRNVGPSTDSGPHPNKRPSSSLETSVAESKKPRT